MDDVGRLVAFEKWWLSDNGVDLGGQQYGAAKLAWIAAVAKCREACLEVSTGARASAQLKDAYDYVAGYQDAAVDCDEALRELCKFVNRPPLNTVQGS
jgi:hypothetical protein